MPSKKQILFLLFFIPSTLSFLKLFTVTTTTQTTTTPPPPPLPRPPPQAPPEVQLTPKELGLLSSLISRRSPCNLLVFGHNPQLLYLSALNPNGTTLFLEHDRNQNLPIRSSPRVQHVEYHTEAGQAFELLKQARADPSCITAQQPLRSSSCVLALRNLPVEVYETRWDVVVVDGLRGDAPCSPGRMGVIYSVGLMARGGDGVATATDVVVHDVDRVVERWYSWEFLCEDKLVASKGRLWHFRVERRSISAAATRFCRKYESDCVV